MFLQIELFITLQELNYFSCTIIYVQVFKLHNDTLFVIARKNVTKNKNLGFPKNLYEIQKKIFRQNCTSQEDIQNTKLFI